MSMDATVRQAIYRMTSEQLDELVDVIKARRTEIDQAACRRFGVGDQVQFREKATSYFRTRGTVKRIKPNGRVDVITPHGVTWTLPGHWVEVAP